MSIGIPYPNRFRDLNDVDFGTFASGEFVKWDGTNFVGDVSAGGASALDDLTDVTLAGVARGDVLYRGAAVWQNLAPGTAGHVLTSGGAGADPTWTAPSSGVTDHGALTGLADDDHAQYALADKSRPATWVAAGDLAARSLADLGTRTHALLTSLAADDHTQYALLAGRAGGQTLTGGTAASENLALLSTSHATKGKILLGAASAYDSNLGFVGIGTQSPTAQFHSTGNISAAAWGQNGIASRRDAATYTDTSSSGTVANAIAHGFGRPTLAASSATVFTHSATLYVANSPLAGSNVTLTNPWAFWVDAGDTRLDGNLVLNTASLVSRANLEAGGALSTATAWATNGIAQRWGSATYTKTSASGTDSNAVAHGFGRPTFAADAAYTLTDAANVYIANDVAAGSNQTLTRSWALWVDAGACRLDGNVLIGGTALNTSAAFQVDSTTQGVLLPRMTTTQRDAISSPAAGLLIYNTTTGKLNFRAASAWEAVTSA